jgi:hypothetical protein
MDKDKTDLIAIYDIAVADERHFYTTLLTNIRLFWSIIAATIVGIYIGTTAFFQSCNFLFLGIVLILGAVVIFIEAQLATGTNSRTYRRLVESIAFRANIEKKLGLTERENILDESYWAHGPIIPENQIEYRKQFKTSKEFIDFTFDMSTKLRMPFSRGSILTKSSDLFLTVKIFGVISFVFGIICVFFPNIIIRFYG